MSNPYQSFDPEEQQTMSEHVNKMLEILKDMSKSIARMQASKDQIIDFLDKQSSVISEIKDQSKVQGSHQILENQGNVLEASPIILESNMLEDAPTISIWRSKD